MKQQDKKKALNRPVEKFRCYYFCDGGVTYFEVTEDLRDKWNALSREKSGRMEKQDYEKFKEKYLKTAAGELTN